ncbi:MULTISPECIES: hypothetical protein [unclassified Moorena]|nr:MULTISPECIES: hypothetical protein [unclassified Moorena]
MSYSGNSSRAKLQILARDLLPELLISSLPTWGDTTEGHWA